MTYRELFNKIPEDLMDVDVSMFCYDELNQTDHIFSLVRYENLDEDSYLTIEEI